MVKEASDLTGSSWSTSGQYLRAGGGCSSMLIRRKSSTDDEYHHEDMVGVFGVLTNATGTIIQNNVSDAYSVSQYVDQNGQVQSGQIATCMVALAEPGMQSSPNGGAVASEARGLQIIHISMVPVGHPPHPCGGPLSGGGSGTSTSVCQDKCDKAKAVCIKNHPRPWGCSWGAILPWCIIWELQIIIVCEGGYYDCYSKC